jgi:hypothetical protein
MVVAVPAVLRQSVQLQLMDWVVAVQFVLSGQEIYGNSH